MQVIFTLKSRNAKTGPIPVTTTQEDSCPAACPLKRSGCYAEHGPLGMLWRKMRNAAPWSDFLAKVAELPAGQLWRHNQAGDLPHNDQVIDAGMVRDLISANAGKRGFTYTHHDMAIAENREIVRECNSAGFTVNLSADNLAEADELAALRIAPVVVVLPHEAAPDKLTTAAGNRVVVCPATYRDSVTCRSCGLCARQRDVIVGFPAHGQAKAKAAAH